MFNLEIRLFAWGGGGSGRRLRLEYLPGGTAKATNHHACDGSSHSLFLASSSNIGSFAQVGFDGKA